MISLPKMGRPSVSGLSVKALGLAEYKRRYYALHHTPKTSPALVDGVALVENDARGLPGCVASVESYNVPPGR
jgi:hypothetical protein